MLEVLEDRYRVTGFGTLYFYQQEEFELHPVQIEMVEPAGSGANGQEKTEKDWYQ